MDKSTQKFKRGSFVMVGDEMLDLRAIVMYSSAQEIRGSTNTKSYCLLFLDKEGNGDEAKSWTDEKDMVLISDDIKKGKEIIEEYQYPEI